MRFDDAHITYFGRTTFRNAGVPFGIRRCDRRYHFYAIGKTGMGKSTLLATMLHQDVLAGEGFALFDPHGNLADRVLRFIPSARRAELIHLNVPDPDLKWSFNPFAGVAADFAKSGRRDLNPRPPEPHSGALPDCATSRETGPATSLRQSSEKLPARAKT